METKVTKQNMAPHCVSFELCVFCVKPWMWIYLYAWSICYNTSATAQQEVIFIPPQGLKVVQMLPDSSSVPAAISSILWRHGANKAAEWDQVLGPEVDYYGMFRQRSALDTKTGQLTINNMTLADLGQYSVEINGGAHSKTYMVKEMKKVPKPTLGIKAPCYSNSSSCILHCVGDATESGVVTYRWNITVTSQWTGPNSMETRIYNNERFNRVKELSCEINNLISVEQSYPERNLLYKESTDGAPTGRRRIGVVVTVIMLTGALGALIWNRKTKEDEARRDKASKLRGLLEKTAGYLHITDYEDQLQHNMDNTYLNVKLGTRPEVMFENIYIPLYNVDIDATDIHSHHEVRQMERRRAGEEKEIQLGEIFKDPSGRNKRTVLTVGCAGIGKTFLVHKFLFDWGKKCFPQDPHFVFPLKFCQLNLLKGYNFSLAKLIHTCIKETRFIEEEILNFIFNELQKSVDYNNSPFKVMFVIDGYDEKKIQLDFSAKPFLMDVSKCYPVEVLLVNLIKGELLPSAHIWVTSRPVAADQIPKKFVNRMTEVLGFIRDDQKKEFFMKTFSDENQATSVYSYIKESKIIYTMCEIPVFCWILATVLQNMGATDKLPKTLVEMYCYFLMGETLREKTKNTALDDVDKEKLIKEAGKVLLKLGRLAFDQLDKRNTIFYQKDLKACGLDVNKDLQNLGFCTKFFKEDDEFFLKTVYCFVHLSIQEFLAAVYLFHCFTQRKMKVLKTFLGDVSVSSLSDFLNAVMIKTLQSESGHLDLFVRFLHGLSLESNQSLLGGLLGQTENSPEEIQRAINNLKEMDDEGFSPDRCINIFHCLMEMKDCSLSQGIQQYLESESRSGKKLTETQCSALANMLLMSEEVLEEFDLDKYNTDKEGRLRLFPALMNCTTARLVGCRLEKEHTQVVAAALSSDPSHLRHLDLSYNNMDQYLDLLCAALKSPHCRLETLRLMNCWLSERSCEVLSSALRSNPSHLRELDLTFNVLPESGLQQFSGLETLTVKHGGHEHWTNPQLLARYFHPLTLDQNTASRTLCLSDNNRKVSKPKREEELQSYPDHPDRFDDKCEQVLCTEGLTGRHYWEIQCSGGVKIGVTYRGISRREEGSWLGWNDKAWCLFCDDHSYAVVHNSRVTVLSVGPAVSRGRVAVDRWGNSVYRVSVYLDCPAGTLSFYEVSADTLTHLYTFQNTFTEPLYPGFRLHNEVSSVCLCEDR